MEPSHKPVLVREVLDLLDPRPGQTIVDATLGVAGHARQLVEKIGPSGRLIGLDQDPQMLVLARERLEGWPATICHGNFEDLGAILQKMQIGPVHAILADLGFCSDQLTNPQRGLSFQHDGPLDMRLDSTRGEPAAALVRRLPYPELAEIFRRYGEDRHSRRIARKIVATRCQESLTTTRQLAELVRSCVPRSQGHAIDPATRVFQALRIAVNDELGALERFLRTAPDCLYPGGRLAVISFHSLEDRLVKQSFRDQNLFEAVTRKPVQAGAEEIRTNPGARSAKLRVAKRKS